MIAIFRGALVWVGGYQISAIRYQEDGPAISNHGDEKRQDPDWVGGNVGAECSEERGEEELKKLA
jgi:hypothetical protein